MKWWGWWRKRPSVHVADDPFGDCNTIDMSPALWMIDAEPSPFVTMMQKLSGAQPPKVIDNGKFLLGDIIRDGLVVWRVAGSKPRNPDDWFDTSRELILDRPWDYRRPMPQIEWLEYEFAPKITTTRRSKFVEITGITG